ncbi:MAG TPA: tripartite tricarboxylate transporter substrate-binding protein [Beijerinckiaceae bacterium]|jgi:tripartite-type tricarboxylate transporter receptor subunit TctC|nr:tripartite tricarboxylate transporter substrate-binding protein [Beijerinckiaceae bacterium]
MNHRIAPSHGGLGIFACLLIAGLARAAPADAQSAKDFYAGKQVRFVIASGAGGGFDVFGRLLARHLGDHIPGHPSVVIENMPGASGVVATNWLYNQAARDGTVLGATYNALLTEPLLGDSATRYDPTKFNWIGSIDTSYITCAVWHESPIETIQDAMRQEVKVSTTGFAGNSAKLPLMLNKLIGTKFKVIAGYSTTGMRLALERGEADGICGFSYATFESANPEWVRDNKIRFILQTGPKKTKELPDVPLLRDLVKDPKQKAALKVTELDQEAGRPVMFPPGVPEDRVKAMRTAFDETMKDPGFLADARTLQIDPDPMSGEDVQKDVEDVYATPKDVVALTAKLWPPVTKSAGSK